MVNGFMEEEDFKELEKVKNLAWLKAEMDDMGGEFATYMRKPLLHLLYAYAKYQRTHNYVTCLEREQHGILHMGLGYTSIVNMERMVNRLRGAFSELSGAQQLNGSCSDDFCKEVEDRAAAVIDTFLMDLAVALGREITIHGR